MLRSSPTGRVARLALATVAILVAAAGAVGARAGRINAVIRIEHGLPYAVIGGRRLLLDAYLPGRKPGRPPPGVVFVHGGGWRAGERAFFAPGEPAFAPTALRLVELGFAPR